jgi:hypothetical protein
MPKRLAVVLLLLAPKLHAEPDPMDHARVLFHEAKRDEDAGHWLDARNKLAQVLLVRDTAGVRYHLALCDEQLGHLRAALDGFLLAQSKAEADQVHDVLRLVSSRLTELRERIPRLRFVFPPDAPHATVTVDGADGAPALGHDELLVDPGEHRIDAVDRGRTFSTRVFVVMREHRTVQVRFAPSAPASPSAPSAPHRTGAVLTTVGSVAFAAAGLVSFVVAGRIRDDAVGECAQRLTSCDDLKTRVRLWDSLALGAWVGAGTLGVVSIVLWTRPNAPGELAGVGVAGSF